MINWRRNGNKLYLRLQLSFQEPNLKNQSSKNVIPKVICDCHKYYIGQNSRPVKLRIDWQDSFSILVDSHWVITVLYHRVIQQHPYTLFQLNTCPQPFLNNASLPQVTSVKYLGHRLDQKLDWRSLIWHKSKYINLKTN